MRLAPRLMGNITLRMELSTKDNLIQLATFAAMEYCTTLMVRFAILEDGQITLFMDSGFWIIKQLLTISSWQTMKILDSTIPMLGIITKGNFVWIRKMDLGHSICVMETNSVVVLLKIKYKDMEHSQAIQDKECQEFGTRIYLKNYE